MYFISFSCYVVPVTGHYSFAMEEKNKITYSVSCGSVTCAVKCNWSNAFNFLQNNSLTVVVFWWNWSGKLWCLI